MAYLSMSILPATRTGRTGSGRSLTRCLVCGFAEVRTDEVQDAGALSRPGSLAAPGVIFLSRCPRCDHRWTTAGSIAQPAMARVERQRQVEQNVA